MKKVSALISIAALSLVLMCCGKNSSTSKSFDQCKINGLSLINASANDTDNGKVIGEFSPVPQKITLNLSQLSTSQVMFLPKFEPEDCASEIDGTVEFVGSNSADITKSRKPLALSGIVKTNIFGHVTYISPRLDPGARKYEVTPRFLKDSKMQSGEKLKFDLEVIEK